MPWKIKDRQEQRYELIRLMMRREQTVKALCRRLQVSRKTAYKWLGRYRAGRLRGLVDRSRRPRHLAGRTSSLWLSRLRRLRQRRPTWGARKLRYALGKRYGMRGLPAVVTWSRWLKRWGMVARRRRYRKGPVVLGQALRPVFRSNEVWTVDFKGWYRTGDGQRVDPLTVRDLYSRYGLGIRLLTSQSIREVQRALCKIFRQYGLPERIRSDNGTPFGGGGPTGLTRLSAWWVKLGIEVEFIRPGCPYENGAHEQFHRVYQAEVVPQPAQGRRGQQQRSDRWLRYYNEERPHEGLRMKVPKAIYRLSQRRLPPQIKPWTYPQGWSRRWVKGSGEICWHGQRRFIGEAFANDYIGLKPGEAGRWEVYFGPKLIGELLENESANLRLARYRRPRPAR
jgi:putative transposase